MFKSPRRNGRNKGFKIKHVIQISMLFGVSIWLLYQIHHSDEKKPSVTTKIAHKLNNDSSKDVFKLGRKDLRPKVKEAKADDEPNNEKKESEDGSEDVEDRESEEHEEVGENEHVDIKEDSDEIKEHKIEEENDYKGNGQNGKIQMKQSEDGSKSNKQNQAVVMESTEKKMGPSEDDDDGEDERSIRGEVENDKMMNNGETRSGEGDTGSGKQPSVDHNEHNSKDQTAQQIGAAPDSYSYETNTASYMKSTGNDKNTKADTDSEAQSKNGKSIRNDESEKKDDAPMLEEEKDVLTDLEMLQESGTGGSITLENAATE